MHSGQASVTAIGRRRPVTRAQFTGAIVLSVVPDLGQLLPVAVWTAYQDHLSIVRVDRRHTGA